MLLTSHAVVGAAIGAAAGDPLLGFLGGFVSHHLLDAIPHFDQGTFRIRKEGARYLGHKPECSDWHFDRRDWAILFADAAVFTLIANAGAALLPVEYFLPVFAGVLGGLLPDIVDSSPLWSRKLRAAFRPVAAYHTFHAFFHWTVSLPRIRLGLGTQLLFVTAALIFLFL